MAVFLPLLVLGAMTLSDRYRRPIRQFSIRDLLFYVLLWSICLTQISAIRGERDPFEHFAWRKDWIIVSTWIVLAAFYVRRRDFASLLVHSLGVLFIGCVSAIAFAAGYRDTWDEVGWRLKVVMFVGSFAGLICFSILTLLGMFRRVEPPQKEE